MSSIEKLFGRWILYEWAYEWCRELPIYDEDPYKGEVEFLGDFKGHDLPSNESVSGAKIIIDESGFLLVGKSKKPLLSYDRNGIQVEGAAEFKGGLELINNKAFLKVDKADLDNLENKNSISRFLRCSRSNFSIVDYLTIENDNLVRKTVAVTDGIYGDIIIQRYKKGNNGFFSSVKKFLGVMDPA